MNSVLTNAENLRVEALALISDSGIMGYLNQFGACEIVGSAAYNLMTWRDLDLELLLPNTPDDNSFWKITRHIFSLPGVASLSLVDNRQGKEADRPRSMYIGVKFEDKLAHIWRIDIRILRKNDITSDRTAQMVETEMSDAQRLDILEIKSQVCNTPEYKRDFSGVDIYEAVIRGNVRSLTQFNDYLSKRTENK